MISRYKSTNSSLLLPGLRKIIILVYQFIVVTLTACNKLVEVDSPKNSLTGDNVYTNDATSAAVLTGVYTNMSSGASPFITGIYGVSIGAGLSADELSIYPGSNSTLTAQYQNALSANVFPTYWQSLYAYIHTVNAAIEGLSSSTSLTASVRQQLLGEAKFLRAFYNFYLINLYGDIPLVIDPNWKVNSSIARTSTTGVYQKIVSDLKDAINLLSADYKSADAKSTTMEKVRPNKVAAQALLARVYLYLRDWTNAEIEAGLVINNNNYTLVSKLSDVFLANSKEAILQLQPVNDGWNTEDAKTLILPPAGPNTFRNPVYIGSSLLNSFETGDSRKINWIHSVTANGKTYYYSYKYTSAHYGDPVTEYLMVLRLSEQYLISAEARAQQNKISDAQSDLNLVRSRSGLTNTPANDKASLLTAILHERQVELFTELGHRWLDLKRTGTINNVMSVVTSQKGGTWDTNWQLYPISLTDIQLNPLLVQNSGY